MPEGHCVEEEAILERAKAQLEEDKKQLTKEKNAYTAAIIKLNREVKLQKNFNSFALSYLD